MIRYAGLLALSTVLAAPAFGAGTGANTGATTAPAAGAETGLPGGASSLQESYDNWTVGCRVQEANGTSQKLCNMTQVQADKNSGKRVLEVDVTLAPNGAVATLILPFGLALPAGVKLQVDTGEPGPAVPFATCLPVGCVVRLEIDGKLLGALRTGTELKLKTVAASGQATDFSVPLKGFGGALDRMTALLK